MTADRVCSFTEAPTYTIEVGGRSWRFEWSDHFGPLFINKCGSPMRTQPNPIAVLAALSWWAQQGKRVEGGLCVWETPPEARRVHLFGRHWVQVGADGGIPTVGGRPVPLCPGCPRCAP